MTGELCGSTKNVSSQPTRSQLIFGGFRGKISEARCEKCEKEIVKMVDRALERLK